LEAGHEAAGGQLSEALAWILLGRLPKLGGNRGPVAGGGQPIREANAQPTARRQILGRPDSSAQLRHGLDLDLRRARRRRRRGGGIRRDWGCG
jgi:hypothetical protein